MAGLPRSIAVPAFAFSASSLALGLRWHRIYFCLLGAALGWLGGTELARLMYVSSWTVATPTALVAGGLSWPISGFIAPVLFGVLLACAAGQAVSESLQLAPFWLGFAAGLTGGILLGAVTRRFTTALVFAVAGAFGCVTTLGIVVNAPQGPLSPGAHLSSPFAATAAGAILFVLGILAQAALEAPPDAKPNGKTA